MNYSTIKKVVLGSLATVMVASAANAQDSTMTTMSSAKLFGGAKQYRTWSFGLNAGIVQPVLLIGGTNDFTNWNVNLGYGATLRKQVNHAFGVELGFLRADVEGTNEDAVGGVANNRRSFKTQIGYQGTLMADWTVSTLNFLHRENAMNLILKAGGGVSNYAPQVTFGNNTTLDYKGKAGNTGDRNYVRELIIPVGAALKFKLSDRVNFDLGYNMYFVDGDNFDGTYAKGISKDKYSYAYGGIEFSLGSSSKPNLDWANPIAMMYDELKDPTLRQEVEALKGRVAALEAQDLLKDSDGDGVADKLDKCPNTEAGVKVDGSGCPLDVDADGIPDSKDACPTEKGTAEMNGCPATSTMGSSNMIMFEFNSSVLRTSAYPTLDKLSSDLRSNTSMNVQLDGHASAEGTDEYNMSLSRDRANSVKTYLVNSGVAASRITTKAYGESRPIASNATEEGRIQNRRVEIK